MKKDYRRVCVKSVDPVLKWLFTKLFWLRDNNRNNSSGKDTRLKTRPHTEEVSLLLGFLSVLGALKLGKAHSQTLIQAERSPRYLSPAL